MTKFCRDCLHVRTDSRRVGTAQASTIQTDYSCANPNNLSVVSGQVEHKACAQVRAWAQLCGPDGTWFRAKEEQADG